MATQVLAGSIELAPTLENLFGPATMDPERPYNGQPWTSAGTRGQTEIKGITFRDLSDAFIRAFIISHPYYQDGTLIPLEPNATLIDEAHKGRAAKLNGNSVFSLVGDIDPIAVSQNLGCEVEKLMGIYPNCKIDKVD